MRVERIEIAGRTLRLTLHEEGAGWHWMLAVPGELLLSGTASERREAVAQAWQNARLWARRRGLTLLREAPRPMDALPAPA